MLFVYWCHRYSQNVQVLACEEQYAKKLQGSNVVPVCVPASVQLNGSAIPIYNSSSIYDKLLWAATWMYKATGDTDYLGDAESFYIRHIYDEGAPDVRPLPLPFVRRPTCTKECTSLFAMHGSLVATAIGVAAPICARPPDLIC